MALKKIRIGDATYDIGGTSISVENNNTLTITTAEKQEITDLTHTIWTLNPNAEGIELYYSNNEDDYSKLNYENPEDRTIIILGGEDVTNKDLISYLQSNATFVGFDGASLGTIKQIVIDDKPYDLGGSGSEIIEIEDLEVIPEEYRDFNKLQHCLLRDGGSIYHLSYDKCYFECIDDLEYKYIYINEDFEIERQYSKSIVTSDNLSNTLNSYATRSYVSNNYVTNSTLWNDYMSSWETEGFVNETIRDQLRSSLPKKQDKLIPGDNVTISANGNISVDTKLKCEVVDELPELTLESTKENKLYSHNGKLYHVIYDTAEEYGCPLNLTNTYNVFPNPINGVSAAAIGTDIYIFGGYAFDNITYDGFYSHAVYKFDTITKILTLVDTTLDFDLEDSPAVTMGTDIYFINYNRGFIGKFNTVNKTFERIEVSDDVKWNISGGATATAIGTDIYMVTIDGDITKFDTVTLTATTVDNLDNGEDMGGCSVKAIGNILYIFGGFETNTIIKYDTTTNVSTTLSSTFYADKLVDACSVVFDNKIIILGGHDDEGNKLDKIYSFDPSDDSLTILDATLPDGGCKDGMAIATNNTELYVIAGDYNEGASKNIFEYSTLGRAIVNIRYQQLTSNNSAGGIEIIPNPTLSGSETVLTGIAIDGTNYKIPSGGSGDGTVVEANPTDDATDVLAKLKVAGVTYSLPSGGDGSLEPIIKEVIEGEDGVYFTLTEDELARITNNLGTVVNLDLGGVYLPLTPTYFKMSMTTMQAQFILCAEIVELNGWYKFEPTAEDPLTFAWNQADMSSPFGDGVNFSSIQIGNIMPQNGDSIDGASGTITEDQYDLLHATLSTGYADMYRCRPYLSEGPDEYPVVYFYPSNLYGYFGFAGTGEMYKLTFTTQNSDGTYNWSISQINNSSAPIYTYTEGLTSASDFNNIINGNYTHVYLADTGYECPWIIVSKGDNSYICELTTGFMSPASTNTIGYDGACKTYIRFNYDSESNAVTYNYYNVYTSTVMGNPDEDHTNDVTEVSEPLETILINDKLYSVGGSSGTVVEANPTLSGSEADLTSIAIDGTNYKLSSGSAMNIVPITESLTWDETAITLTKERYDELMAASHISVVLEESTLIFNATAQNSGLKTFISTIFEGSLYCFMVILTEDPEGTYNLIGTKTLITINPTTLTSGNIPVAIDGGMIEDSGIVAENIVTTDVLKNKITFIVNEDNTLDLIIN